MVKMNRKPKILLVSDSSALHTGFAKVAFHICSHLCSTDKYVVKTIGWFHNPRIVPLHAIPYEIIPTRKNSRGQLDPEDCYATHTFPKVMEEFKPDIVIGIGDPWMVKPLAEYPGRSKYKLILYIPIDGIPLSKSWKSVFESPDVMVAYGKFGADVIVDKFPDIRGRMQIINHGVDIDTFKVVPEEEAAETKKMFGGEGMFIIGTVSRNQPRKNIPRLLKMARLFKSSWVSCRECRELTFLSADDAGIEKCIVCGSTSFDTGMGKKDFRLYLHMALNDCGWNISEMTETLGLKGFVAYPEGLQIGKGVGVETLAKIISAMDVFTLPTGGEGWGLPIIEAMSCGVPTVVTNYSAHVDFCKGAAELIEVSEFESEPVSNIERALVDLYDYTMRIDRLYYNSKDVFLMKWGKHIKMYNSYPDIENLKVGKEARKEMSLLVRAAAEKYSWNRINSEWETLVDEVASTIVLSEWKPEEKKPAFEMI
jgi:glycosyltransferase involved in cell wall biosynthesis